MNPEPPPNPLPSQYPMPPDWKVAPPAATFDDGSRWVNPTGTLAPNYGPVGSPPYPTSSWPPVALQPPIDGFAITSLITGLVGGVFFSVGFGIAALVRIRRGKRRGRILAITGLALSLAWLVVLVAVVAYRVGREPDRSSAGIITRQGQSAPADLHVGDCLWVPRVLSGTYTELTVVPCGRSHNGQVFDILRAQGDTYPGAATVRANALRDCKAAVPDFLGTGKTLLHVVAFFPPRNGWNLGRRDEHCLLVDRAKNITGDIRNDK